jgi:hypothetical protein
MSVVPQLALHEVPWEVMGAMIDPVVSQLLRRARKWSARKGKSLTEKPRHLE